MSTPTQIIPQTIYPPHPLPERGLGFFFSYNAKKNRIVYCSSNLVIQRNVDELSDCEIYNQHPVKTSFASYSPNGRWIASGDIEGHLRIWTPQNAEKTLQLDLRPISGPIVDMSWTEDSQRLAVVGKGQTSFGTALNAETGASLGEVMGHSAPCNTCALRAQRPFRMITAGDDATVVFYKGPPFKFDHTIRDHEKFILCARYAPDGSIFATCGIDCKVHTYDGVTGEKKNTFTMTNAVSAIEFSPDSKQILLATMDGRAIILDAETGETKKEYMIGKEVYQSQCGCLWTPKHKMTISLNGDFNFLQEDGSVVIERGHTSGLTAVATFEDGFATGDNNGRILFWHHNKIPYAVYCPDNSGAPISGMCVMPGKTTIGVTKGDGHFVELSIADGSVVKDLAIAKKSTGELCCGSDFIVTYSEKNLIYIKDGVANTIALNFTPSAIAVSHDGSEVAVGATDKNIYLYDPAGQQKGVIKGLLLEVCAISYSPDDSKIAASSNKKEIVVWDRKDYQNPVHEGWRFHSLSVTSILWIDEMNLVTVSMDRSIRIWSLKRKRVTPEYPRAHEQAIVKAVWIAPGTLMTIGSDGCARTWAISPIE